MAKSLCTVAGVVLLIVGGAGFAKPHLLGMHLTTIHNVVHLLSGALALYMGAAGSVAAARRFCIVFGSVYLLLGVLGFAAPGVVAAVIRHHVKEGSGLMPDSVVHLLLGAGFLLVGLISPRVVAART
jgi:hypothetical protein